MSCDRRGGRGRGSKPAGFSHSASSAMRGSWQNPAPSANHGFAPCGPETGSGQGWFLGPMGRARFHDPSRSWPGPTPARRSRHRPRTPYRRESRHDGGRQSCRTDVQTCRPDGQRQGRVALVMWRRGLRASCLSLTVKRARPRHDQRSGHLHGRVTCKGRLLFRISAFGGACSPLRCTHASPTDSIETGGTTDARRTGFAACPSSISTADCAGISSPLVTWRGHAASCGAPSWQSRTQVPVARTLAAVFPSRKITAAADGRGLPAGAAHAADSGRIASDGQSKGRKLRTHSCSQHASRRIPHKAESVDYRSASNTRAESSGASVG